MFRLLRAIVLAAGLSAPATAGEPMFCDQGGTEVCPHLPHDIPDFFSTFVYRFMIPAAQDRFDVFSWQTFVALNWPTDTAGTPLAQPIGTTPTAPRRWQFFSPTKTTPPECPATTPGGPVVTATYRQATGELLIDRDRNYVVYDTRLNRPAAEYTASRRATPIAFPDGHYTDATTRTGGDPGAAIIKTAWRILPQTNANYLTVPARIAVAPDDSLDNRPHCHAVTLGLVGMHIMRKVRSGNGADWIWSTFEHVDNAPLAANARGANNILTFDPFPTGCHAPPSTPHTWSFHTPNRRPNQAANADPRWAPDPPFARHNAPSQVVRCWQLFEGTAAINRTWQAKLRNTVFANYQLIGTQWRGNRGGPVAGVGEVPRYLTNTTLETFGQAAADGSCMTCHSRAVTAAGDRADFTFLLAD